MELQVDRNSFLRVLKVFLQKKKMSTKLFFLLVWFYFVFKDYNDFNGFGSINQIGYGNRKVNIDLNLMKNKN